MTLVPRAGVPRLVAQLALTFALAAALLVATSRAHAAPCPAGNLMARAQLTRWLETSHDTALLTDGSVAPEEARWTSLAVIFTSQASSLTYDLGEELPIGALYFQGDADATFSLRFSLDGKSWREVSLDAIPGGHGMRARSGAFAAAPARYVRIGEPSTAGAAATELELFCEPPKSFEMRIAQHDPDPTGGALPPTWSQRAWWALTGTPMLTPAQANAIKAALAAFGAALLVFGLVIDRRSRDQTVPSNAPWWRRASVAIAAMVFAPIAWVAAGAIAPHRDAPALASALGIAGLLAIAFALVLARTGVFHRGVEGALAPTRLARVRSALLLALGLTSFAGYYNWGSYRFPDYAHGHELFHYYVGSKYFDELGYTHLYECAELADAEQGFRRAAELRRVRDLRTNTLVDGSASLEAATQCKTFFSPERWEQFKGDVAYFRDHATPDDWDRTLRDLGYNASPAFTMTASLLANRAPASRGFIGYADSMSGILGFLDPILLLAALGAIVWAFGWRVACVAAVFLGCNPLASFLWTGGAYLRQDWLALVVLGICLLKRLRPAAGGALLAWSALLRVFPGILLVPLVLKLALTGLTQRRLDRPLAKALAGAAVAGALLFGASSLATGGVHAWKDFAANTAKLKASESVNLVGLKTVFSFRPSTRAEALFDPTLTDPFERVRDARKASFKQALPFYLGVCIALLVALGRAVRRVDDAWMLACVGAAIVPIATDLSCYYASYLVVGALLLHDRPRVPVALLVTTAVWSALHLFVDNDVLYAGASVALVAFVAFMLWSCGSAPREESTAARDDGADGALGVRVWIGVGVASIALLVALRSWDATMDQDATCEERWTRVAGALDQRADLVAAFAAKHDEGSARDQAVVARALAAQKRTAVIHPSAGDFCDPMKIDALARSQRELRDALTDLAGPDEEMREELERADASLAAVVRPYDSAVEAFNAALASSGQAVTDRARGEPFRPRALIGALTAAP